MAGLWLLLASALAVIMTVGLTDDIHIGSWTVRKAPVAAFFTEPQMTLMDSLVSVADSIKTIAVVKPDTVATDTVPKSILLFGDSMTFNLAIRLAKYARQNGHDMHAVNWDSSNTKIWAGCDTLTYFIRKYDADFIFISLGSNEVYFKNPETRLPYVRRILEMIGDIPYVWIGPPNWNKDTGINDMLTAVCAPGSFFRSEGMEFKRKADKIHPTRDSSAKWMDSIMNWMPKSRHPILHDLPSDSIGKVKTNIVFLKPLNK